DTELFPTLLVHSSTTSAAPGAIRPSVEPITPRIEASPGRTAALVTESIEAKAKATTECNGAAFLCNKGGFQPFFLCRYAIASATSDDPMNCPQRRINRKPRMLETMRAAADTPGEVLVK